MTGVTPQQSDKERTDLPKLELTCSSTNCKIGLHYFGPAWRKRSEYPIGICKDCGADLVDWGRVHRGAAEDMEYVLETLKRECWRHHWWHREIDSRARNHARRKGRILLKKYCREVLEKAIGPAEPFRDGAQTRTTGNIVCYGQHATGTCCRKCLEYWHGIQRGIPITLRQLDYLTELVMHFVDERMPELGDAPERVPPLIRRNI